MQEIDNRNRRDYFILECLLTIVLVYFFFFPFDISAYGPYRQVLTLHFLHGNAFHLLSNLLCMMVLRIKVRLLTLAYILAVCAAMVSVSEPTIGFSGVLFAYVGILYGYRALHKGMCTTILLAWSTGMLPQVAMLFHLSSLIIGYATGRAITIVANRM